MPEISRKRLNALVEAGGYGGGMKIAMRDLEIRGAGDILGVQQSGQISAIGFHLYCKLLKRAIDALKKKAPITFNETKMEFSYDARIPEDYITEVSLRMEIYYRLGEASTFAEIDELLEEMKDRFGAPPEPVLWLYHLTRIRVFAAANHFSLAQIPECVASGRAALWQKNRAAYIPSAKKFTTPAELEAYATKIINLSQ